MLAEQFYSGAFAGIMGIISIASGVKYNYDFFILFGIREGDLG